MIAIFGVLPFAGACGDDGAGTTDAGRDGSSPCSDDTDCDDGLFCNGLEACVSEGGGPGMCLASTPACAADATCDEDGDRCIAACGEEPDQDGDGHDSLACGGDDCDDTDPSTFPGNAEVCDPDGHDEDCDPETFGARDGDADGQDDAACCNGDVCGSDCNDSAPAVYLGATEICNGRDDDCDGAVDEGALLTFYRDRDGDSHGDDDETVMECSQPTGYAARGGDCADDPFVEPTANDIHPGADEICDDIDNDCDGAIDEELTCGCTLGVDTSRACGFDPSLDGIGNCRLGTQMCVSPGTWTPCAGAIPPTAEVCNGDDDDCDGTSDEGVLVTCWADPDRDGFAARGAMTLRQCPPCPSGYTTTNPATMEDCGEGDPLTYPGAPEICDRQDQDCSRGGGVETAEDYDNDGFTAIGFSGCSGGFPKTDCHDRNRHVHPGQDYRGVVDGYCQRGWCPCSDGRCRDAMGGFCGFTPCSTGTVPQSFDWNCDGMETRQPAVLPFSYCACPIGLGCTTRSAPTYSGSPACGTTVQMVSCVGSTCGSCPSAQTPGPLPCR
jgi:hypothetical protein